MLPDKDKVLCLLRERLTQQRFEHSLNVAVRAGSLARRYGLDVDKADFAGLVHDICKYTSCDEQLALIRELDGEPPPEVLASPQLYHAIAACCYIKSALKVEDVEILNAVRYHTTGRAGMCPLEKVVYLADMTSADRDFPEAEMVRELSEQSLDAGMLFCMQYILPDLVSKKRPVCTDTLACYNELVLNALKGDKT